MFTSESISNLAAALIKAKAKFKPALKTAQNPQFKSKYVDLAGAIDSCDDALLANALIVIQSPTTADGNECVALTTRLLHESGEWMEDTFPIPARGRNGFDAQSCGSAITYARRYAYMAILGLAPEDDDGSGASGHGEAKPQKLISAKQAEAFREACKQTNKAPEAVKKALSDRGIAASSAIPVDSYDEWMEWAKGA